MQQGFKSALQAAQMPALLLGSETVGKQRLGLKDSDASSVKKIYAHKVK